MDPNQYAKVRDLFLKADDLVGQEREDFIHQVLTREPESITRELLSLLDEHHVTHAKQEGSNPSSLQFLAPTANDAETDLSVTAADQSKPKMGKSATRSVTRAHSGSSQTTASSFLLASQTRKSRRRNNAWLWIAALLPTALIGWLTYQQVNTTMKQAVRDEMRGVSDSVSHAARRFLSDKEHLVESWTRQPMLRQAIHNLRLSQKESEAIANQNVNPDLRDLEDQLIKLSGMSDVRFSLWGPGNEFLGCNDSFMTSEEFVSSIDLNNQDLRRGQTIVFGPTKMDASGFADTDKPEMGILTPISDESGTIIATILVTRIGIFQEFSRMFFDIANAGNLDAYAINESGIMLTESPRAATLSSIKRLDVTVEQIAAGLRVSDPGFTLNESNRRDLKRSECPLTESAMSVTNGYSQGRITPYRNYAGIEVVGSWRWNSDSRIGVIVERPSKQAFATVRIVQGGFLLLGSLLFISASVAAAFLARATTAERAAMHPLSRYDVLEEVGSGGMGVVFLARHRQLGRKTALKVMIGGTQKKEDRMRFDREARLAASLSNPHSVMIYDYGRSEDGESYCVMEFLRGLTLQEVVERSGSQPFGRVLFILRQVCEAVSEAHQKRLLHLDIKPQNIMLSLDQTVGDWAVLFDYGLSKPITPALDYYQTPDFQWSGTPMYMAPERIHRRQQLDQRSDIYALGCVAYFLTTGHPPFFESNPDSLLTVILNQPPIDLSDRRGERVPDQFAEIIIKCLSKTPTNRFQSVGEFAEQIEQLQSQHSWSAEDSRQWWKKHGTEHTDQTDFATS